MQAHYRHSCRFIILLCIAAFGPYVIPKAGVRLEHFVIYGGFFYVMIFKNNVKFDRNIFLLLALWLAVLFWILAVSLRNLSWAGPYPLCAALDNFIQPLALIIVICAAVSSLDRAGRQNLFRVAGIAVIAMLCLNSFISILTVFYNTWPFLQYFVVIDYTANEAGFTVMQSAASMGRFSGIFNQPVEAGLAYSVGLLVWVYIVTTSKRISSIGWISLILLIIGGSLSVSKSFILGGFPLAMLYWFWIALSQSRIRKSTLFGGMIWGLAGVAGVSLLTKVWGGLGYLLRLFDPVQIKDQGAISLFTACRFGAEETGVKVLFAKTWSQAPVIGFGIPMPGVAVLDNAYIEFFLYGGIVGLAFYIAILAVILRFALRGLRTDPELGRLLVVLWILIIGAGIGAPVFTINRSSILLWVILVIAFGVLSKKRHRLYPETHSGDPLAGARAGFKA